MIFTVVLGHLIEPNIGKNESIKTLYLFIYSFHMPVFVFLSGMYSKIGMSNDRIIKNVKSIFIPLIVFTILYEILSLVLTGQISGYTKSLAPHWILWFLFSLFVWRFLLTIILKFKYPIVFGLLLTVTLGYFDAVGYSFGLSRTIYFLPFFIYGYRYSEHYSNFKLKKLSLPPKHLMWIIFILGGLTVYYFRDIQHQWLLGSMSYSTLGIDSKYAGAWRVLTILFSGIMILTIMSLVPNREFSFSFRGKHSLYVYLWHGVVIKTLLNLGWFEMISGYSQLISFAAAVILAILLTRIFSSNTVVQNTNKILLDPLERNINRIYTLHKKY